MVVLGEVSSLGDQGSKRRHGVGRNFFRVTRKSTPTSRISTIRRHEDVPQHNWKKRTYRIFDWRRGSKVMGGGNPGSHLRMICDNLRGPPRFRRIKSSKVRYAFFRARKLRTYVDTSRKGKMVSVWHQEAAMGMKIFKLTLVASWEQMGTRRKFRRSSHASCAIDRNKRRRQKWSGCRVVVARSLITFVRCSFVFMQLRERSERTNQDKKLKGFLIKLKGSFVHRT